MINLLPPHLLGPSDRDVQAHIAAVLDAVAPLPVIVQFAPAQTGTALNASTLSRIAEASPNLVQVKVESTPPGQLISALAAQDPPLRSVVGYAGVQMIDALRRGADGVQPGCSFSEIYLEIWRLWTSGNEADAVALHSRLLPYIAYWMQSVELIIQAEKRISMLRGLISTDVCRTPSRVLDDEESAMIDRFLAEFSDLLTTAPAGVGAR
jgi:4-hydroxy-tetrahydrodipicolinate synthase